MSGKLKVLISAHIRWFNGEAEYAYRLARGLLNRGVEALLWGLPDSPLISRARAEGLPVITLGNPASFHPATLQETVSFLRELIGQAGISVVNAHRSEGFALIARTARQAGCAVVRTRGDMRLPRFSLVNRPLHRRWTDMVITGNDLIRDNLIARLGLDPDKVQTIRLGIRPEEVTPRADPAQTRRNLGIRSNARIVGVMGRLGPVKGQEFVLRAAPQILAAVPDTVFLIIYRDLEASDTFLPALRRSGLARHFVFVGPGRNHLEAMALAEMGVIPSVGSEAHCRVALEWMALSKPVIGSRVGVIPEIVVPGETGFLVQPRYHETLAACIIELLHNPARARSLGERGRTRLLEHFTEDRMVEENLEVFQRLAAEVKSPRL